MPGLARELLDRVHERHAAVIGEEADRVAMRAAAEAMVEALVVVDGEARRLLVVERAACFPLAPGAEELHRRRDDAPTGWCAHAARRGRRGSGSSEPPTACGRGLGVGLNILGHHPFAAARLFPSASGRESAEPRRQLVEFGEDGSQDPVWIFRKRRCSRSDGPSALPAFRNARAPLVVLDALRVLASVELQHRPLFPTQEIANEWSDRHLMLNLNPPRQR